MKRLLEVGIVLVVIATGVLYFRHQAEVAAEEEARRAAQFELAWKDARQVAQLSVQAFSAGLVAGLEHPYDFEAQQRSIESKLLDAQLRQNPDDVTSLMARANWRWHARDYPGAGEDLDRVLEIEPENLRALYLRAWVCERLDDYQAGLDCLDRCLSLDPDDADCLSTRAYFFAQLGAFDDALVDARAALIDQPNDVYVLDTIGYSYVGLGRYKEAVAAYDRALPCYYNGEYSTGDADIALSLWGRAAARLRLGDQDGCREDLERALVLSPDFCLHWKVDNDPGAELEKMFDHRCKS
ncbi:MAG: tetratricopeptide repeat protein [Candidatus Eremiobacteraeota bacterium]|nr:tetratricopeptide repeat protein [Candidatus Eremiobacteraeota bacterium]